MSKLTSVKGLPNFSSSIPFYLIVNTTVSQIGWRRGPQWNQCVITYSHIIPLKHSYIYLFYHYYFSFIILIQVHFPLNVQVLSLPHTMSFDLSQRRVLGAHYKGRKLYPPFLLIMLNMNLFVFRCLFTYKLALLFTYILILDKIYKIKSQLIIL